MATVKNDYEMLRKALDRPRRYVGVELELTVSFPSYAEKVEDEVACALGLVIGDAVEYSVVVHPENLTFQVFAQGDLADLLEEKWDAVHRLGSLCEVKGRWIFGVTEHFEAQGTGARWFQTSHYGLYLETLAIADREEK